MLRCSCLGSTHPLPGFRRRLCLQGSGFGFLRAGFLAVGGWAALLFPLTLFVFLHWLLGSGPAWSWRQSSSGSARQLWLHPSPKAILGMARALAAVASVGGIALAFQRRNSFACEQRAVPRQLRTAFPPASLAEVCANGGTPDPATREMGPEELAVLRYLLDRALQPIEEWAVLM